MGHVLLSIIKSWLHSTHSQSISFHHHHHNMIFNNRETTDIIFNYFFKYSLFFLISQTGLINPPLPPFHCLIIFINKYYFQLHVRTNYLNHKRGILTHLGQVLMSIMKSLLHSTPSWPHRACLYFPQFSSSTRYNI